MNYQWLLTGLLLLVIFEVFFSKIFLHLISWLLKLPVIALVYFALYWFWTQDGPFNRTWVLVFFIVYLLIFTGLLWWLRKHPKLRRLIINAMVFIVPVISIFTTNWLASIMKVDNQVTFDIMEKFLKL
ncbi:MAG: hypothetical protein ACM3WV_06850 [Bacillota bacterium]